MKKKIAVDLLLCASLLAMLAAGILLFSTWGRGLRGMAYWRGVARQREAMGDWAGQDILPRYQPLYDSNPDIVGWLSIEGRPNWLDYPVMQTKDDPEHYLWLDFDGNRGNGGAPFADYRCDVVPVKGFNTVVYGHNGAFSRLYDYAYKNFRMYREYRYIRFDTLKETGLYEVAAVFYIDARDAVLLDPWDPEDPLAYECYNYLEVDSPEGFRKFLDRLEAQRLYETDAEITLGSHVLTLMSCAEELWSGVEAGPTGTINGRIVVVAVQVGP